MVKTAFAVFFLLLIGFFLSHGEPNMFELLASKTYAAIELWEPGK